MRPAELRAEAGGVPPRQRSITSFFRRLGPWQARPAHAEEATRLGRECAGEADRAGLPCSRPGTAADRRQPVGEDQRRCGALGNPRQNACGRQQAFQPGPPAEEKQPIDDQASEWAGAAPQARPLRGSRGSPNCAAGGPPCGNPEHAGAQERADLLREGSREEKGGSSGSESDSEAVVGAGGLTAYELEREARIQRNNEAMRRVGLLTAAAALAPEPRAPRPPRKRKPVAAPSAPMRRSRRLLIGGDDPALAGGDGACSEGSEGERCPDFASRGAPELHHYVCPDWDQLRGGGGPLEVPGTGVGVCQLPGSFQCTQLARSYSLDMLDGFLAAGGKGGNAAVWSLHWPALTSEIHPEGDEAKGSDCIAQPLVSARLHAGWVSDVQLVARPGGPLPLLLSAGNDGALAAWNLGMCARSAANDSLWGAPMLATKVTDLHAGAGLSPCAVTGGIFSMHEAGGRVVTGSKDAGIALCELQPAGGFQRLRAFSEHHAGVIKCVRWRDGGGTFASCGNDRCVRVTDTRASEATLCITGAHGAAVNHLRWRPGLDAVQLLSCAAEPGIHLWDVRAPATPLHRFTGHILGRCSQIYQPVFVRCGAAIATGGQGSSSISLYCNNTGATLSRGLLTYDPTALCSGREATGPLACAVARGVRLLQIPNACQ